MSSAVAPVPPASPPRAQTAPAGSSGGGGTTTTNPNGHQPGLDENEYRAVVLHLTDSRSEADIDSELAARAAALGISTTTLSRPASATAQKHPTNTSCAESAITVATAGHARSFSTGSAATASTALTSHSSLREIGKTDGAVLEVIRKRADRLSFSQYDKYLANVDPDLKQPKLDRLGTSESTASVFSTKSRKGYTNFRRSLERVSWLRKRSTDLGGRDAVPCICCREEFEPDQTLHYLPCGHTYCSKCLHVMINQAGADESKMPPRCCTQPIPSSTVRSVLSRDEQHSFLKAVVQFSVPWEARIFCPAMTCLEFIPPRSRIDPKHPSEVVCRKCRTRVCVMCKKQAHPFGQDCPGDWELDAVLKMGEKSGWRRCYKCRSLVELTDGCTHMTCRCKAQFCYICGAVWDNTLGCPNYCDGEGELERMRQEEAARTAEEDAIKEEQRKAVVRAEEERKEADERTASSEEFKALRADQEQEMARFRMFERKTRWVQWSRHSQTKSAMVGEFASRVEKMKERHAKTAQQLEDRQVAAEMELRATLEQSERSVRIRLRHMEAYCDALGRGRGRQDEKDPGMPPRVVTERDLRELGQQYNLRDGMERLHQARINVLRDQQAKRMEDLLDRQEREMETLLESRAQSIQDLEADFVQDEEALTRLFEDRKNALYRRWELAGEIMRKELEQEQGVAYGPMQLPEWPAALEEEVFDEGGIDDPVMTTTTGAQD
ncbi:uncharacterized protein E0L32_008417 [Thyridium curvatum]|uniref:RBR-type E3 ubiquitin transferase n=1 Tax=Thyridium curvatum TaxID=1093900 RepID=A0A507ASH4_9PEZI|nr:uncharacterized protein E0L32_008417 [Thyridium curvatum]TPX10683.1 hypothetical protein E0L32_008417 [Thyridium curvatum]